LNVPAGRTEAADASTSLRRVSSAAGSEKQHLRRARVHPTPRERGDLSSSCRESSLARPLVPAALIYLVTRPGAAAPRQQRGPRPNHTTREGAPYCDRM